jgi:hypothetical protein
MTENIALLGTVSGSISNNPTNIRGLTSYVNDDDDNTEYGFDDTNGNDTFVVTVVLDLGETKPVSNIVLMHRGECNDFGELPNSASFAWSISTSINGTDYTEIESGLEELTQDIESPGSGTDRFNKDEDVTISATIRYIKIICEASASTPQVFGNAIVYAIKELEVWTQDVTDIGLRVGSLVIGTKIATNDEALRIFVNGEIYGIPFSEGSPVKIKAGTITGLPTI